MLLSTHLLLLQPVQDQVDIVNQLAQVKYNWRRLRIRVEFVRGPKATRVAMIKISDQVGARCQPASAGRKVSEGVDVSSAKGPT